jgi:hypothetical protein
MPQGEDAGEQPYDAPLSMSVPPGSVAAAPMVTFSAARIEPDIEGVFLANKAATTIGSAAARAQTDLHITGCAHATGTLLTTMPSTVELQLDATQSGCFEHVKGDTKTLYLSNRTRLNLTTSRTAVAIDGTVVDTMSGQASVNLDSILKTQVQRCSSVIPVVYANWLDYSSVVEISNVEFLDPSTGEPYESVTFVDNPDFNEACKRAASSLEDVYNQSVETRKVVVFKPAPPLSKSVMRVPFGIDGSTYDLCASVVSRPVSMDRVSFESMIKCAMQLETNFDQSTYDRFAAECARPGIQASRWSKAAANALSTIVNMMCPYRIDGRTVLTPTGLQMTAAESWKAEASRSTYSTADDCDGSAAHACSAVFAAKAVALDPELSKEFPSTAMFANALSLHFVGVAVLAANAGNAGDAGKNGEDHVAGHAIALALPKSMVLNSMVVGVLSATQGRAETDSNSLVDSLRQSWSNALFSKQELAAMTEEDVELLTNVDTLTRLHLNASVGHMEALAIEGTSPVSPSLLYSRDPEDRISRRRIARGDKKVAEVVGPSVARSITQLDVGPSNVDTGHVFYSSIVEFILSTKEALFLDPGLRSGKYATSQFVLAQTNDTSNAGATPKDIATGNFTMLPLWKVDTQAGADMDVALEEVQRNTMPKRLGVTTLDTEESEVYRTNISALKKLHSEASTNYDKEGSNHISQYIFAVGTLINNREAVRVFVDRLRKLSIEEAKIAVSIDIHPMMNTIFDSAGADVGKFVVVNVELL